MHAYATLKHFITIWIIAPKAPTMQYYSKDIPAKLVFPSQYHTINSKSYKKVFFFCAIYSLVFNGSLNNIDKILGLIKCQLLTIRPLIKSFKIDDEIL